MKLITSLLLAVVLLPGARANRNIPLDPALNDRDWIEEALSYSYYWYLDDAFFAATAGEKDMEVWIRSIDPPGRDPYDHSRFGEIWLPAAGVVLSVKKADYFVPEINLTVRSPGYRVVRGAYASAAPASPDDWTVIRIDRREVMNDLASARHALHVPGPAARAMVETVLQREMKRAGITAGEQTFYVAARTGVATDVWIYWLDRRTVLQVSGDLDITAPGVGRDLPLFVRAFHLGSNVVASVEETRGSNALISRERASRVLFLCVARGQKMVVKPEP